MVNSLDRASFAEQDWNATAGAFEITTIKSSKGGDCSGDFTRIVRQSLVSKAAKVANFIYIHIISIRLTEHGLALNCTDNFTMLIYV